MKALKVWICVFLMITAFSACSADVVSDSPIKEELLEQEPAEAETVEEQTERPEETPVEPMTEETVSEELPFASYEAEGVWIYFPNEDRTDLASQRLADDIDVPALIEEMKQRKLMSADTKVNSLVVGTATTMYENGTVVSSRPSNTLRLQLDLSEEYLHTFDGVTPKEERLKVKALVNTLLKYMSADELELRCNGEYIETECYDYHENLYFTDPA